MFSRQLKVSMSQSRTIPATRPLSVVTPVIKIDGSEIARTFRVDSITVAKEVNRIPWAKIVLIDGETAGGNFQASNGNLFVPGKEIEILSGYQNDVFTIFKGLIIAHSLRIRSGGSAVVVLECRDKTARMTIGRKSRYFLNLNDTDIISNIAGEYSQIQTNANAGSVNHKQVIQHDCTDWDFIVARAEANGRFCIADDSVLTISPPDLSQQTVLSLTYGATILELDAEIDSRHQLNNVKSRSWNFSNQQVLETDAANPSVALNGNLSSSDLANVMGLNEFLLNHGGKIEEPELKAWADALMLKRQLAKVRGRVKCKGIHTVKPGMLIELNGVGDRFNGKAFVSGIQHYIAAGDWQLDIQFGCSPDWFTEKFNLETKPASGLLAGVNGLQVGVVVQLAGDPDSEDRIKIHLPMIGNNMEGVWARISTLDAGSDRGSFFRPEVGDEVIVGFINDDPRDAVVLGMVHSSSKPTPFAITDSNNEKGFVTRSRLKMIFDDDQKSFTVETPGGKKIKMNDQAGETKIEDEHQNRIVMDATGISLQSAAKIELKAGQGLVLEASNLELKAQAKLALEGGGTTEMKSGGTLTIKGSLVQIN